MKRRVWVLFLLTGTLGAAAGWLFSRALVEPPQRSLVAAPAEPTELVGEKRPEFTLGSIDGRRVSASDFDDQVLLINFWATWCAPCREEMPMLSELHRELAAKGFGVVGIALDDVQQVREFASELKIAYPVLVGMADVMATGRAYGNRSGLLPYSVLIDRRGFVRWTHMGVLSRPELEKQVIALL